MKRLALRFLLASLMVAGTASIHAQQKIATVDLNKLFDGYWRTKAFSEKIRESNDELTQELQRKVAKLNKEREAYQKLVEEFNEASTNKDQQEKLRPRLQQKKDDLDTMGNDANTQLQQSRERLAKQQEEAKARLLQQIRASIAQKAKSGGYDFVFDTSGNTANSAPSLLFNTDKHDLTEAVLTMLNANAPMEESSGSKKDDKKEAAKPEAKPAASPSKAP